MFGPGSSMVADHHGDDRPHVARMRGVGRGIKADEMEANARLIASAPRLLAALEDALRYISLCEMEEVVPTTTGIGYGEAEDAVAAATMEGHQ